MAKAKTFFECGSCSHREPKWAGRCPQCGEWNSLIESRVARAGGSEGGKPPKSQSLAAIEEAEGIRFPSGIGEFDRVLGGGVIRGTAVLVGGEPGIGKSTLMLQGANRFPGEGRVLYISGEEAPAQIKSRARRLGVDREIEVLCEPDMETIMTVLGSLNPQFVIVDSIQTIIAAEAGSVPGTPNQLKYICHELIAWARSRGSALFLVAHITKEGIIAGPKVIEHMVDTVLYFDSSQGDTRFLRATKNRFGSVDEVGLFSMTAAGLEEVADPSSLFLVQRERELPSGIATATVFEGSRVLLIEIQALTVSAKGGLSRTFSDRIDPRRVSRIAAVIEKHMGLRFSDQDVYINVAGGMALKETGIDLAIALALYSARTGIPLPKERVVTGELSLAGEVRPIPHLDKRIKTAGEMGFSPVVPRGGRSPAGEGVTEVRTLKEAVAMVFKDSVKPEVPPFNDGSGIPG